MSSAAETMDTTHEFGFDPDALHAKYLAERDKRLRADGNQQYREIAGAFAHYLEDPYVEPVVRAPLHDEVEVVVIGGGFAGLLTAARLRQSGVTSLRMIEKGGDFGGTWYWNRYPGAACDTESYIYLPLLEEVGYMPVEKYTRAPEILKYCRMIGEKFDLYRDVLFQTEIKALRWDDAAQKWVIETNRGDAMKTKFVVMANGPLHRPKLPGIEGVESFKGHSFHTSRWDYDYTGGDSMGNLKKLKDKRVAIIGTGATAVQCIPHLGASAKQLYVFQRTPSSIDFRNNRPTDSEWVKSLEPGWQKRRMDNFNVLVNGGYQAEDLVNDGWTEIIGRLLLIAQKERKKGASKADAARLMQMADYEKMESIRKRAEDVVQDRATAEALKPWYNQFCKRPCFHDEYLATFNRPSVQLVDTDGKGVERITEKGIIAGGVEYEVDCIIYSTGFEVGTSFTRRSGYEVHGRDGITLSGKWKDGVSTLHSFMSRGFPNCLMVSNAQGGATANFTHMIEEQSRHIAYIIDSARKRGAATIEPSEEGESEWVKTIESTAIVRRRFFEECTPGYYNNEGQPNNALARRNGTFGAGPIAFVKLLEDWRAADKLDGLELN